MLHVQMQTARPGSTERLDSRLTRAVKRVSDLTGAVLGILFLMPVMLVVVVAIKLDTPGPILFRQLRIGRGGQMFCVLKFRTMVPDAEARLAELEALNESPGGLMFKIRHDPRVTRLGRFLRRTSLDELPQLINVLWGEMSLVGPRPLQLRDFERLVEEYPDLVTIRLSTRPGLTGMAQISGRRDIDPFEILKFDHSYVLNWSLAEDLLILLRTIEVVLSGRGAL